MNGTNEKTVTVNCPPAYTYAMGEQAKKGLSGAIADTYGAWIPAKRASQNKEISHEVSKIFMAIKRKEMPEANASKVYLIARDKVEASLREGLTTLEIKW